MHVSRGGQLTPYGDPHGVLAETKAGLDQVVCERAYLLWEQADRPDGCADDFWHQRFCERAYALWEREGCPEGKADEHWFFGRALLRTADPSIVTKIERLAGADRRTGTSVTIKSENRFATPCSRRNPKDRAPESDDDEINADPRRHAESQDSDKEGRPMTVEIWLTTRC
jgi:Protein of unknown function (DUF2934)